LVVEVEKLLNEDYKNAGPNFSSRALGFFVLGVVLIFIGIIVMVVASFIFGGSGNVGGVILIGPIPIVFGVGSESWLLIAIGILITVFSVVLYWFSNKRLKRNSN
jgi:uncharacterized membrane protein